MKKIIAFLVIYSAFCHCICAQENKIVLYPDSAKYSISRHIYGHFSEHLGHCIYGGIYVGEKSKIPNVRGIRTDVVEALKDIAIPNLRWPGGCFADEYHWRNGIGPKGKRPSMINTHWGGVTEDNSFGTHEFLDLCQQLNCEPVIVGNVGSGTVEEMSQWVEYINSDNQSPMTDLRKMNGREEPWNVTYWGIGNESWGCGGTMKARYYSDLLRRYSTYCRNYGDNKLYRIASGANSRDYNWTKVLMSEWASSDGWKRKYLNGLSLHYYTVCHRWSSKGSAKDFNEKEWYTTLSKTLFMEELITKHSAIMDTFDHRKRIGLVVDEWGNWHDVEPGTNPGFLYQQNTLRDAMVASVNFDIFNKHCDRVVMANIAQVVNVLQSVILTKEDTMLLTPTFYVFKMYKVHHDAKLIPSEITSEDYIMDSDTIPAISSSASIDTNQIIHITLSNLNHEKDVSVKCEIKDRDEFSFTKGEIITGNRINSYNDFGKKEEVNIAEFRDVEIKGNHLEIMVPAKSIIMIELK